MSGKPTAGVKDWVGSLGIGVLSGADGYFDEAALAVMVAAFPDGAFRVMAILDADIDQLAADDRAWIDATEPTFAIVHGDPTNARTPALVDGLAGTGAGFLVGGLTSSRGSHHQVAGEVTDGGVSGVLFAPTVEVATSLSQGCTPMAEAHEITDCQENVLMSLDGRPALEVFKEDIGELLAHDLQRVAGYVHAALPIVGTDTGDYTVRNLMAIDPDRGWLAIGAEVQPGDRVLFVRRDPSSAIEDMQAHAGPLETASRRSPRRRRLFQLPGPRPQHVRQRRPRNGHDPGHPRRLPGGRLFRRRRNIELSPVRLYRCPGGLRLEGVGVRLRP